MQLSLSRKAITSARKVRRGHEYSRHKLICIHWPYATKEAMRTLKLGRIGRGVREHPELSVGSNTDELMCGV